MLSLSDTLKSIMAAATGRPIEIHDIYLGSQTAEDSNTLHFVNYYRSVNFFQYLSGNEQAYTALGVNRTAVKKTTQCEVDKITYRVDNVNKAMGAYAASKNFRNKRIVTRLIFRNALSSADDAKVIFDGLIQNISFPKSSMIATAAPIISSLAFETGWPYQIQCNAKFGDDYCKVVKNNSANKVSGTATGGTIGTIIDTTNLTQADDYWNFGTIEFTSGDNEGQKRKIVDFDAATDTLTPDYSLPHAVAAGDTYILYRGCDYTLEMCGTIYNNETNYHGFHSIPLTK